MFKSFLNRGGSNNNNNNKDDGVSSTSKRDVVVKKKKSDNDDDDDDGKQNNNNDDTTTTTTTNVVDNNDDDHIVTDNNTDKKKEVDDDDDKNKIDHDHDATTTTTTPGGGAAEPEEEVENTTSSSSSSFTSRWRLAAKKTFANAATAASAAVATATAATTSSSSSAAAAVAKPTTTTTTPAGRSTTTTITSTTSGATVTRSSSIKRANSSSTRNAAAAALVPPVVLDGPSVYDDAKSMLAGAMIIYFFADIRDMAREGLIEQTLESLEPPLTVEKVIETITQNREELTKRSIDHEDLKQRLEIFKSNNNNNNTSNNIKDGNSSSNIFRSLLSSAGGGSSNNFSISAKNKPPPAILKQFVDTKAHEEIVHGIVVNHAQRRISVIFRGSVTQKDFIQDAKCSQLKVVNPVSVMIVNKDHTTENIGIHTGFYEYLFKEQTTIETTANEAKGTTPPSTTTTSNVVVGKTRYHDIMDHIKSSLREHPGYSLYFSGHSLGGALCTLCGFYAATDNELCMLVQPSNRPIQIYSIASPYVGNWKFKQAFQYLERMKRVQHLRIANHEDLVTLMPFAVPKLTALSPALSILKGAGNLYKHCGMKLQFIQDQENNNNNNNNNNNTLQEQKNKEDDDDGKEEEEVVGNESERSTTIPAATAASSSCRQKLYSISYPKDHEAIDDIEYKKELNDNIMAGKSLGSALYYIMKRDIERVTRYHSCEEYERRLTLYCGSNGVSDCSTDFDEADDDDDNDNAGNNNLSTRSSSSSSRLLPPPPPQLRYVTLNDLYNDRSIVGNILDIDYIPKKPETGAIQIAKRAFHGYFGSSSNNKDKSNNNNNNSMDDNDDNDNDEKKESTNNNNNISNNSN